jgi:hypothetical protein
MIFDNNFTTYLRNFMFLFEVITALIATIYYWKYNNGFVKYFLYFLWYILIHESITFICKEFNLLKYSFVLSNIYQLISFSFYLLLYFNVLKIDRNKKIVKSILIIYLIIYFIHCIFVNIINNYYTNTFITGSLFIVTAIILYLIELLNSDLILKTTKLLMFWITVGLFIYYIPLIPFKVVEKYYYNSVNIPYIYFSKYILVFLMNISFIIGFICSQKIQKD